MVVAHDLSGQRFGLLTAVRRMPSRQGVTQKKTQWEVLCDCGKSTSVDTVDLLRKDGKHRVSCGCRNHIKGVNSTSWKSPNDIPFDYWTRVISSAERKGRELSITIEYAHDLLVKQEYKCALSGLPIGFVPGRDRNHTASLDRVESSQGYVVGNIQWLHKDINQLKSNWPQEKFVELCGKVTAHHNPS